MPPPDAAVGEPGTRDPRGWESARPLSVGKLFRRSTAIVGKGQGSKVQQDCFGPSPPSAVIVSSITVRSAGSFLYSTQTDMVDGAVTVDAALSWLAFLKTVLHYY